MKKLDITKLKQFVSDLKNVNPKNPGGWPWPIKIFMLAVIVVLIVVAGALLDWQGKWDELSTARQQEETLKADFLVKKQQAINLDLIKKQLLETQQSFGALLKQLPDKSEMDALLTDINQAGLGRGLQFDLFRPGPEVTAGGGMFAEQPIAIKVTGNYDDLGAFASDISQLPRIVTLNNLAISRANGVKDSTLLTMDATAKTYRYLDETEIAAQKKAAKGKGGKK